MCCRGTVPATPCNRWVFPLPLLPITMACNGFLKNLVKKIKNNNAALSCSPITPRFPKMAWVFRVSSALRKNSDARLHLLPAKAIHALFFLCFFCLSLFFPFLAPVGFQFFCKPCYGFVYNRAAYFKLLGCLFYQAVGLAVAVQVGSIPEALIFVVLSWMCNVARSLFTVCISMPPQRVIVGGWFRIEGNQGLLLMKE